MDYIFTNSMSRRDRKVFNRPVKISDLDFVDMYRDVTRNWEVRARNLRARREAKLKHQFDF